MRDDLRGYVLEHFADPGAVLVVGETGDVRKGTATVGTRRQDPRLRAELARRGLGYVLAVAKSHPVVAGIGPRPAIELAQKLPARAWQRLCAGPAPRDRAGMTGP